MKTYTGKVTGQSITTNRDSDQNVRMLQVEITEPDDVQTIQQVTWPGDDNAPVEGDTVIILEISPSYKIVIGIEDQIDPSVDSGERKLYSQDSGTIKSFIYLKKDGQMILNGSGDFGVRFTALETAFNQFKSDFNTFITTKYNLHNHPTAPVGPVSPPSLIGSSTAADMSGAKIDSIEVPS